MTEPGNTRGPGRRVLAAVGECSVCRHARTVVSSHGSTFWLCERAAGDARFRKYPALPVRGCPGFEPEPETAGADGGITP